jgi:hypothetical protein
MKIHHTCELGNLVASQAINWLPPCITYVIICILHQQQASALWTLWRFFPHIYPMPHTSYPDRLLMASHDMSDALNHPYPDVPFSKIGDDTITAMTTFAAIFKNKYKKPSAPVIIDSPIKAAENKRPAVLIQPVITSPSKNQLSNKITSDSIHAHLSESQNSPQLPRVQTRAHDLSPRNLSQ